MSSEVVNKKYLGEQWLNSKVKKKSFEANSGVFIPVSKEFLIHIKGNSTFRLYHKDVLFEGNKLPAPTVDLNISDIAKLHFQGIPSYLIDEKNYMEDLEVLKFSSGTYQNHDIVDELSLHGEKFKEEESHPNMLITTSRNDPYVLHFYPQYHILWPNPVISRVESQFDSTTFYTIQYEYNNVLFRDNNIIYTSTLFIPWNNKAVFGYIEDTIESGPKPYTKKFTMEKENYIG
mgnify:CR=1 FL=1